MNGPDQQPLRSAAIYNPHLLSKEELNGLFVVREPLLERLLAELAESPEDSPPQHHLVVGQRGMGKTMLLRRLQYALEDDPDLGSRWLPLAFPEEQYNVAHLSDFWFNCLDALSDALDRGGQREAAEALDREAEAIVTNAEDARARESLDLLTRTARELGRRLVLLVDNLDLVFERVEEHAWKLRETLSSEPGLLLLGASARAIESTYKYDRPFYDFFEVHELGGLSVEETRELLVRYAEQWDTPSVARVAREDAGRIRTLHTLTGGNPRTIALLYSILAQGIDGDVRSDLEQLLDQCTPLYKARLEALPQQAQQVVHALAVHWHPATAGGLAETMRLPVNAVSSQLNRLVKQGIVEKVPYHPDTRTGFQIAERFFNIWYLMRTTRRARRKLLWLVEFLRVFYSQQQLQERATRHLAQGQGLAADERLRHAEYAFALAEALQETELQSALETSALFCLIEEDSLRQHLAEIVDLEGDDARLRPRAEHKQRLEEVRRRVLAACLPDGWDNEALWQRLGAAPWKLERKEWLADRLSALEPAALERLRDELDKSLDYLSEGCGVGQLSKDLKEAIRGGFMTDPQDVAGARTTESLWSCSGLVAFSLAWKLTAGSAESPLADLRSCLDSCPSPFVRLAYVAHVAKDCVENNDRTGLKEIATVLEPVDPDQLENPNLLRVLGQGLLIARSDPDRSERAFRKCISRDYDQAEAWAGLGYLLADQPTRYDEAEAAFEGALALRPGNAPSWVALGRLLGRQKHRAAEAEKALRNATDCDPDNEFAWQALGELLTQASRFEEAEEAFLSGLKSNDMSTGLWSELGRLYFLQPSRKTEAESAFRKALDAGTTALPRAMLAVLLAATARDNTQAESLAREAVELSSAEPYAAAVLAFVLAIDGKSTEAIGLMSGLFKEGADENSWPMALLVCRLLLELAEPERIADLVDALDGSERHAPLREALRAVVAGHRDHLRSLAPEVQQPANELLDQFVGEGWPAADDAGERETRVKSGAGPSRVQPPKTASASRTRRSSSSASKAS